MHNYRTCQNLQNMMEMFLKDGPDSQEWKRAEGNSQKDKSHAKHFWVKEWSEIEVTLEKNWLKTFSDKSWKILKDVNYRCQSLVLCMLVKQLGLNNLLIN